MKHLARYNRILAGVAATAIVLLAIAGQAFAQRHVCDSPGAASCDSGALATRATSTLDPRAVDPGTPNPLASLRFFVDKAAAPQYDQYRRYLLRGDRYRAALVAKIALQPQFKWFGRWNENDSGGTAGSIRSYIERVQKEQPGSVPQIVTLRHQGKKCGGGYSGGGAAEDERTRRW